MSLAREGLMDGGSDGGGGACPRTAFGGALERLRGAIQSGAETGELVRACKDSLAALPVRSLADAAGVLALEVAALEAEGPGKVWRIAAVSSVRDLLADLAASGASSALLSVGDGAELQRLERDWQRLVAAVEAGDDSAAATGAAWSALGAIVDAPMGGGLSGVLVRLRVLLRVLDDSGAEAESVERRLVASTIEAVERLGHDLSAAESAEAALVDDLFLSEGTVLAPIAPSAAMIEVGVLSGGVTDSVVRRVYAAMIGTLRGAK